MMPTRFKFLAEIQIFQREMRMIYFFLVFRAFPKKKTTPADVIKFNALTIRSYLCFYNLFIFYENHLETLLAME